MQNERHLISNQLPKPPSDLSRPAKNWWKQLTRDYQIVDSAGILLLQEALRAWDMSQQARKEVIRDGITIPAADGTVRKHPGLLVEKESRAQFLSAFKALHLDTAPQHPEEK